jgi:hypothetical protein
MAGGNLECGLRSWGMVEHSLFLRRRIHIPLNAMNCNLKVVGIHRTPDSRSFPLIHVSPKRRKGLIRGSDGNAVLRSSIREFLISEHLNALGIPTTRALALTVLPNRFAMRERVEPCAIVCRKAESWIRVGTFDLFRNRGDRDTTRKLAEYCIQHVFGGEDKLPKSREGEDRANVNRFEKLYREICVRNARTVAKWYVIRLRWYSWLIGSGKLMGL